MAHPNRRIAPGSRGVRLGDQPVLSVVLFARDPASLEAQLPALARCCRAREVELVVVGPIDAAAAQQYESQWTGVRFVSASPSADEAQLRRLGLITAQGDIVAFTDGERSVGEGWLDRLVQGACGEDDTYGDDGAEPLVPGNGAAYPFVSVVVPAHQAATVFTACLEALEASNLPRTGWELIIVDDASTDDTELIAAEHADTVVRLAGNPHGPAYARNRGAEVSRGDVLVFVDADVLVHPDALRRFADLFAERPDLSAAFGSYDSHPRAAGLVSQYRNLLHHYVHHANSGPAETFWAGLGAVRRDVFLRVGAFDEWHYSRPQIEDIEFGRRLRRDGYEIWLEPTIQGTHLKRWTLASMLVTDFQNRGVPWMWLLLQEGQSAGSRVLNLRQVHKLCTALIGVVFGALIVSLFGGRGPALACVGAGLTGDRVPKPRLLQLPAATSRSMVCSHRDPPAPWLLRRELPVHRLRMDTAHHAR